MKNVIIALLVTISVLGSYAAIPVVTVVGITSAAKKVTGIFDDSVKVTERQGSPYTPDVINRPATEESPVSEAEYYEKVKATEYSDDPASPAPIYKVEQKDKNIINVLCFYLDPFKLINGVRDADVSFVLSFGSSEVIRIVTLDNNCYVPIEGHGWNRLGAALEYGGTGLYVNTINDVFDLDIQYYFILDLGHLDELVDWAGGIDLTLNQSIVDRYAGKYDYKVGKNHLDGKQFMDLVKDREALEIDSSVENEITSKVGELISGTAEGKKNPLDYLSKLPHFIKSNFNLSLLFNIGKNILPAAKNMTTEVKIQNLTDNCKKAAVRIEETGETIAVIIIDDIELVRKELYTKLYS